MKTYKAMLFPNGNTAFFKNGSQVPELQESWLQLYVAFVKAHGINPMEVEFTLPDGRRAKLIELEDRYTWEIL